jgi:hypothetical protein
MNKSGKIIREKISDEKIEISMTSNGLPCKWDNEIVFINPPQKSYGTKKDGSRLIPIYQGIKVYKHGKEYRVKNIHLQPNNACGYAVIEKINK